MSNPDEKMSETQVFLQNLEQGHDSAIKQLWERYFNDLRALAARKIGPHVDGGADSVVVSVIGSVIRGIREHRFEFEDTRKLWNLLMTITLHKIYKRAARSRGDQRVVADLNTMLAAGPSPEELAVFEDVIETVLGDLESPYPEILAMRLDGCTRREIAERLNKTLGLNTSDGAIKYKLERIANRLKRLLAESDRE